MHQFLGRVAASKVLSGLKYAQPEATRLHKVLVEEQNARRSALTTTKSQTGKCKFRVRDSIIPVVDRKASFQLSRSPVDQAQPQ